MSAYDWSKFCKRIPVNADKQEVYRAWSTKSGVEKWFLKVALFKDEQGAERSGDEAIQAGDRYTCDGMATAMRLLNMAPLSKLTTPII